MIKCYKENYYRSQFVRNSFIDLNGKWKFYFDDENKGEKDKYYLSFPVSNLSINVPYSYECEESMINDQSHHNVVWYERNINVETFIKFKDAISLFKKDVFDVSVSIRSSLSALIQKHNLAKQQISDMEKGGKMYDYNLIHIIYSSIFYKD